ncbi:Dot/Icm T4SS effector Ceg19 [Legionella cincinnatiensis]|uniref:Coiled-coil protein n=1 Tax=Legionella cincinnatiensis TaxID=28085 RepID=A0A378IKX4_9GAMM|nr:Dot/Icm T4SS effector Ceg19 [Legionella cincinnatiensis]KTC83491.1 coiled-coil protein [Legionella cincinnatiensis]STX35580.1 coiled-coil protein [Legionella cincinnatiensis]
MHKLRELEQESKELSILLDNALLSNSREEKESALIDLKNSELMNNATQLRIFIDPEHPIVSLIKLASVTLPEKINELHKKARLVQHQLDAEKDVKIIEDSVLETVAVKDEPIIDLKNEVIAVEKDVTAPKVIAAINPKLEMLAKVKEGLKSYIESTENRTSEYYYGTVGTLFNYMASYVGMSGYTRTQKLDAIDKLFKNFETDKVSELEEQDITILTTGYLGDALNPLLEDESVGQKLKELLKIESSTNKLQ